MLWRTAVLCCLAGALARNNEYIARPKGAKMRECTGECSPEPHTYLAMHQLPTKFTWGEVKGEQFGGNQGASGLTTILNQHIPQYCGSCWAHATLSALGDRIKIKRRGRGADINLAVQHVLNCGGDAGSCHGGNPLSVYEWIKNNGHISFASSNPYLACSTESTAGWCEHVNTTCKPMNIARTCSGFDESGGSCSALTHYPNATVAEYGVVMGEQKIMAEVIERGPVACSVAATDALDNYEGGILEEDPADGSQNWMVNHVVSIVGWGEELVKNYKNGQDKMVPYWEVRNSWGEHWGEAGFFRVLRGSNAFMLEDDCAWAVPGKFTGDGENKNMPCHENGDNCGNTQACGSGESGGDCPQQQQAAKKQSSSHSLDANTRH
jgi:cathepsin X